MFNISFNFDEVTQKVSNLKVTSLSKVNLDESEPLVQLMDNKIKLTPKTVEMIGAKVGDRIQVNYWTENNHNTFLEATQCLSEVIKTQHLKYMEIYSSLNLLKKICSNSLK